MYFLLDILQSPLIHISLFCVFMMIHSILCLMQHTSLLFLTLITLHLNVDFMKIRKILFFIHRSRTFNFSFITFPNSLNSFALHPHIICCSLTVFLIWLTQICILLDTASKHLVNICGCIITVVTHTAIHIHLSTCDYFSNRILSGGSNSLSRALSHYIF